jgi:hypothetical protein
MADQNTTVAQLPAGYATLAGVIYAVAATSPKVWSHIAWTRMSGTFMKRRQRVDTIKTRQPSNTSSNKRAELQLGLSRAITQQLRRPGLPDSSVVVNQIAVMHVICSNTQNGSFLTGREGEIGIDDPEALRHLRASSTDSSGNELLPMSPSTEIEPGAQFPAIDVYILGPKTSTSTTLVRPVTLTVAEVKQEALRVAPHIVGLTDAFMSRCLEQANTDQFVRRVNAQAAAPLKAVVIELAYKAIEILVACGIILGSSGGAWLGLTLASMFPQRIAAGLFVSSYGQVLSREKSSSQSKPHVWRPVGTVWTEPDAHSYVIPATVFISDHWRDAIGYWLQYLALFVVQRYKLQIRDALHFGPYLITRDAIRYILLVIELFILIICGIIVRENFQRSRRNIIAGTVYLATLLMGLTCVILGQKSFLKPVWKFYLTSRIVDPIAAIGSVAAMNVNLQEDGRVPPEKWVLLWAMGACTVVW